MSSKISKTVGIITKARKTLNVQALKSLYFTMIYPYLLYRNLLWGNAASSTLWPIFKTQKKAIRLTLNLRRDKTTPIIFKCQYFIDIVTIRI